ncbi:MAG: hypothetical protein KAH44_32190 [Oricola sp.]|nr:hypothetical protein [Oricola sp.]
MNNDEQPRVKPIATDALPLSLARAIDHAEKTRVFSSTTPARVWAHRPEIASAWVELLQRFQVNGILPERTKELCRLMIASITNCSACQIARKSDDVSEEDIACLSSSDPRFTEAEQTALRYAELFAADYTTIDDDVFDALRNHYNEAEIVELNMYCAIMLAGGRMTYVQQAF